MIIDKKIVCSNISRCL